MSQQTENISSIRGLHASHIWDYENAYYWFSHPSRINKFLAHFDLYKNIVDLQGDIVELGVYKATSLIRFATFRNALENDSTRKIIGFDAFGKFPREDVAGTDDQAFIESFENNGGYGLAKAEVEGLMRNKGFDNIELVEGNIFDTVDRYMKQHPATRIALLHLDMDVKEPTEFALRHLYDRVVPGGLIVLDDYGAVAGATDAADAFAHQHQLSISKSPYNKIPAYFKKPL
ncbi:TylF/MycF/NovP-related O-methyltransferase [uncultured Oxalicibacterium sp.]|uniref:TylF/MycF/NovP-related O-methyltransferase n=1 Tax=uncultured Oxalicibacterium sp. TaxID=1168540 RepID=UPI0025EFC4D9|nr:TylF/MycF/NovP-related O-methyltransferase [uncultured Oxalicibacterium sp.]